MLDKLVIRLLEPCPLDRGDGVYEMRSAGTDIRVTTICGRHDFEDLLAEGRAEVIPSR